MLEVRDLNAYYGKSHILQGVSFDVQDGEIVTLWADRVELRRVVDGTVVEREPEPSRTRPAAFLAALALLAISLVLVIWRMQSPAPKSVVDKDWIAAYQAVEYRNPETYSINGYSAMKALGEAVKKANSIEARQVENALHALDLKTPIGQIAYDANGDLKDQRIYIFQVQKAGDEPAASRKLISAAPGGLGRHHGGRAGELWPRLRPDRARLARLGQPGRAFHAGARRFLGRAGR